RRSPRRGCRSSVPDDEVAPRTATRRGPAGPARYSPRRPRCRSHTGCDPVRGGSARRRLREHRRGWIGSELGSTPCRSGRSPRARWRTKRGRHDSPGFRVPPRTGTDPGTSKIFEYTPTPLRLGPGGTMARAIRMPWRSVRTTTPVAAATVFVLSTTGCGLLGLGSGDDPDPSPSPTPVSAGPLFEEALTALEEAPAIQLQGQFSDPEDTSDVVNTSLTVTDAGAALGTFQAGTDDEASYFEADGKLFVK